MMPEVLQEVLAALGDDYVTLDELEKRLSPEAFEQLIPLARKGRIGVFTPVGRPWLFYRPGLPLERLP